MNILILTGRFGMGHYCAAEAVKQEISESYPEENIYTIDIMEYLMPNTSELIYRSFNTLVSKWSDLYNFLNKLVGQSSNPPFKSIFMKKIDALISMYKVDLIISTLPISSQYISDYKDLKYSKIPLVTYITDMSSHDEWIAKNTNYYFVGSESIKKEFIKKGIEENKILINGIPVRKSFKEYIMNFEINKSNKTKEILIMGGGLGIIPCSKKLFKGLNDLNYIKTTVITGKNEKMYKVLKSKYRNINVVGYSDKVHEYMKKADVVISKAGGITMFEAIFSEVPICVINPFLAQEINNANYIESENIGKVIWHSNDESINEILKLINDDSRIYQMKKNMRKIKENLSSENITYIIDKLKKGA